MPAQEIPVAPTSYSLVVIISLFFPCDSPLLYPNSCTSLTFAREEPLVGNQWDRRYCRALKTNELLAGYKDSDGYLASVRFFVSENGSTVLGLFFWHLGYRVTGFP